MIRLVRVSVPFLIILLAGCGPNNPPSTPVIILSDTMVTTGSEVALSATSTDPDGDILTWQWQSSVGTFTNPTAPSTGWISPVVSDTQVFSISVSVSDGDNTVSAETSITVIPRLSGEEVEVIIGSPDSTFWIPFDGANHDYYRFQMLYLASEIGTPGYITSLFLMPSSDSGTFNNFSVKMVSVSRSDLEKNFIDNYESETPRQVYYSSSLDYFDLSDEWFELPLSLPYEYDTTKNLIVEFAWKTDNGNSVMSYGFLTPPVSRTLGSEFEDATDGLLADWVLYTRFIIEQ